LARLYYKAHLYPGQQEARAIFLKLEEILNKHENLDLSAYSYLHLRRLKWCVVVIGNVPPERFDKQFKEILAEGEAITLEDHEILKLLERRHEQTQHARYVRKHHKRGKFL
jgi:hypothetical protein